MSPKTYTQEFKETAVKYYEWKSHHCRNSIRVLNLRDIPVRMEKAI